MSVDKIVNKGVAARWPGAYKLMEMISIDNTTRNAMILDIDNNGRKLEEVVAERFDANEATREPWVEAAMPAVQPSTARTFSSKACRS